MAFKTAASSLLRRASNTLNVRTESSMEGVVLSPVAGAFEFSAEAWCVLLSVGLKDDIVMLLVVGVSLLGSRALVGVSRSVVGEPVSEALSLEEGLELRSLLSIRCDLDRW